VLRDIQGPYPSRFFPSPTPLRVRVRKISLDDPGGAWTFWQGWNKHNGI